MSIRTPTSPGSEPLRFVPVDEGAGARVDGHEIAGLGRAPIGGDASVHSDGEAILATDVWETAGRRTFEATAPASLAFPIGADLRDAVEGAVDYILAPLS